MTLAGDHRGYLLSPSLPDDDFIDERLTIHSLRRFRMIDRIVKEEVIRDRFDHLGLDLDREPGGFLICKERPMASIRRELKLFVTADRAWDALADFGAVHKRVAPGFLKDAKLEGESRVVMFANGAVFREHLVDLDHERRRLVYAIAEPPFLTYQGTVAVEPVGVDSCRLVWTVDMLPNEVSSQVAQQMDIAVKAMKPALEGGANGNDQ